MVQHRAIYLQWPTNGKSCMIYCTAPFSITLNDPKPRFQGHDILWCWISQKRYEIQTQFQWNTNRDSHTPYSTVSFRMTLSDLQWHEARAVSLRQPSYLFLTRPLTRSFYSPILNKLLSLLWDKRKKAMRPPKNSTFGGAVNFFYQFSDYALSSFLPASSFSYKSTSHGDVHTVNVVTLVGALRAIGAVSGSRVLYPNFLLDSWKSHFRW